ncbi:hypothetical protein CMU93_15600 [Elizabethkingia anophelis]|uniref:hypothetical protein n=1 Tax=Elizabethkingia TaxID=308865 RepID=UPI00038A3F1E|nr:MULTISPECIES: hypothetical protein [Elizabethkingia]EQB93069.1 hypothetical protein C874_16910 [Elizabethkingia anophelis 502]MDV2448923.1 hypothetical protein [Elizabethkingia anophelis]MDX8572676.1 hypothetical protein [Elizabethkingia sp. HX QKY]
MENKESLTELYKELESYSYIVEKLSDVNLSQIARDSFIEQNKNKIKEMNIIRKKISDIEWKQLTPQQQKDYLDKYSAD